MSVQKVYSYQIAIFFEGKYVETSRNYYTLVYYLRSAKTFPLQVGLHN